MKKGAKIGLILFVGIAAAAASYYFLVWKPAHPKDTNSDDNVVDPNVNGVSSQGGSTSYSSGTQSTYLGKKAYANKDNVKVVSVSNGETVRIKNINEFIGVIDGKRTLGGSSFYTVNGGLWAVSVNLVRLA